MNVIRIFGKIILIIICLIVIIVIIAVLFLWFYPTVGKLPNKADRDKFAVKTKQYYDGQFHNENDTSTMTDSKSERSKQTTPETMIKAEKPSLLENKDDDSLAFTWLGHSSFILQMGKLNILADPVLSNYSSPVSFAGPKRFSEVPITAGDMPEIDVIILSHDHYDHLDYDTIKKVDAKVKRYIVPLGVDSILKGWNVASEKIVSLSWWESVEVDGTTFTLTPSQHFTGRNPLKGKSTFWGGYYMSNDHHKVYYTGDGGYYDVFERVREKLGAPDIMIAECGQYDNAWAKIHMFPEETVKAGLDTQTKWLIPVHWGTFCICNHAWDDSIKRVTAAASENGLSLATPRIGQTVKYDEIESYNEAWWEEYK